jgi:hypothetical protein
MVKSTMNEIKGVVSDMSQLEEMELALRRTLDNFRWTPCGGSEAFLILEYLANELGKINVERVR